MISATSAEAVTSGGNEGGNTCSPIFATAQQLCHNVQSAAEKSCADHKNGKNNFGSLSEVKKGEADASKCEEGAAEAFKKCESEGNKAIAECEEKKKLALAEWEQASRERQEAQRKFDDGVRKADEGTSKHEQGVQKELAASAQGQTSIEAIQLQREGTVLQTTGNNLQVAGASERQQANDRMIQSDNVAAQNGDMAEVIRTYINSLRPEVSEVKENARRSKEDANRLAQEMGGNADVGNNQTRAAKAGKQSGTPGGSKGQGTNGTPTDQQANSSQKKQDEAGSGSGGAMPSMGGSGSSPASSPLAVNESKKDCSDPSTAASNPVCTCRLNPGDSRCAGILAAEKNSQAAKRAANMYSGDDSGGKTMPNSPGGYKDQQEKNISQHGQMAQGAGGSAGKGVGNGVGSKEANDPRQTQARSYRDQQISGKRGGGSYGGGGSGGSFAGGSRNSPNSKIPSTFAKANVGKNRVAAAPSAADLRAQMQARFAAQRRGPASTTGRADITGPHTDQFKKIRVRYAELMGL